MLRGQLPRTKKKKQPRNARRPRERKTKQAPVNSSSKPELTRFERASRCHSTCPGHSFLTLSPALARTCVTLSNVTGLNKKTKRARDAVWLSVETKGPAAVDHEQNAPRRHRKHILPPAASSCCSSRERERERESGRQQRNCAATKDGPLALREREGMPVPTVCPVNNGRALYLDRALCGWLMLRTLSLSLDFLSPQSQAPETTRRKR